MIVQCRKGSSANRANAIQFHPVRCFVGPQLEDILVRFLVFPFSNFLTLYYMGPFSIYISPTDIIMTRVDFDADEIDPFSYT